MKGMNKLTWAAVAILAASTATLYARSPGPERGSRGMQPPSSPVPPIHVLEEMDVSNEQIEQLRALDYEIRERTIELRAAAERAELALRRAMESETTDETTVMDAAEAVHEARGELFKAEISARLKVKAVLGEEIARELHRRRPQRQHGPSSRPQREGQEMGFEKVSTKR